MYFLFKMKWLLYQLKEANVNPLEWFLDMQTLIEWLLIV